MRALISVSDKSGLVPFARHLLEFGYDLVSTGGTARSLTDAGLPVREVQDVTGFPEMLNGRVKTLHPHIHAGLLARRDVPDHDVQLKERGIEPIDLLVSNLYPFETTVGRPDVDDNARIEQIDIGGPAMVRAAAKNFASVIVITDPSDYANIAERLRHEDVDLALRRSLAAKAFAHVATYDSLVAEFLRSSTPDDFPLELAIGLRHERGLRYGENPQQRAAAYRRLSTGQREVSVLDAIQIGGPELSFNNLLDMDAAWRAVQISTDPTVSIVKHTIPCGLGSRAGLVAAFDAALAGDPVSAFGGIVALNRDVDGDAAQRLIQTRFDVVLAKGYAEDALVMLRKKKNLRIMQLDPVVPASSVERSSYDVRPIAGGMLVQDQDTGLDNKTGWMVVTEHQPDEKELRDLEYAWAAARLVRSNAIVLVSGRAIVGVGAGQPNRLESVNIAVGKAGECAKSAALASDAYFPFADGLERAIDAGITAVIQPGGSVRDKEVIAAADRAGIAMIFTGTRHFRH